MSEHARYSPSGAKKWLTCAGSVAMEHGEPNGGNEYSDEGTAAHWLAALCLTEGAHPAAYIGRQIHVVDGAVRIAEAPEGVVVRTFVVDAEFAGHVNEYVQRIRQFAKNNDAFYEERLPIGHVTGEEDAHGTGDAVIIAGNGHEIQVHDLKFGRGVEVFAENNPQLMIYALGAVEKFSAVYGEPKRIRLAIHQPRIGHFDEWDCSYEELLKFKTFASERAGVATTAFEFRDNWLGKDDAYLTPGEHCKNSFCRARAKCPALAKFVTDTIGADFDVLVSKQVDVTKTPDEGGVLPVDLAELGRKNAAVDLIQDWCKQIRAKVEAALFEHDNNEKAQAALGFKLVQGKRGNRAWSDSSEVETLLKKMRLKTEEIYDFSVKSPTKILDALKDQPKRVAKLTPLVVQKEGQPHVAPLGDKRPALVLKPAADEFEAEDGSDLV